MGELVVGKPALRIDTAVSLPLDLVSMLSLLYRATPDSGLDPRLVALRRELPDALRADLDLLHGFSGKLLYYPEEPVMRFEPLRPDRLDATFEDLRDFMDALPDDAYADMLAHALERVHADLELRWRPPSDESTWRQTLPPALTTARLDDVLALIADPAALKQRTISLYEGAWDRVIRDARQTVLPTLREAARRGAPYGDRGFSEAFAALTGQRVPDVLERPPASITRVTFCPSAHLGAFISYIAYVPDLIVYFGAPQFLSRWAERGPALTASTAATASTHHELLEATRALADPTRLRMLDLLLEGELYAQEIVGRLGIAQSAVSRHLAQLERAGLVNVESRRGSKYYAVNASRLEGIAQALNARGARARERLA